jgi:DNA-binding transcriptional MocR family regulator
LRAAADQALGAADPSVLQYGYELGDERFRDALARFLAESCGARVAADELFVSGGVSQALDLVCSVFTRRGEPVLVEEPSYFLALRIFADHGLGADSLPTDENGLLPGPLEARLARGQRPAFLYIVPTHQNPSGATLREDRRRELLDIAGRHDLLVVADEVYHLLSYDGSPPPTFIGRGPRVLSLGSFSKILAPGLRIGWIAGPQRLLEPLASCGFLDSGGGLAPFTSALVRSALDSGALAHHLQELRRTYGERAAAMTAAVRRLLGKRVSFVAPQGGFFHWLDLGPGEDAERLLPLARARGVSFVPGVCFSSAGQQRSRLRLSFSYYDPPAIEEGVARLAAALGG